MDVLSRVRFQSPHCEGTEVLSLLISPLSAELIVNTLVYLSPVLGKWIWRNPLPGSLGRYSLWGWAEHGVLEFEIS